MKILVTGAKGQLGTDVLRELSLRDIDHKGVDREDFDITDDAAVIDCLKRYLPDLVIHCAAYTAVDSAEENPELCFKVNAHGTESLSKICTEIGAGLIYVSTDYVFDGAGDLPFETDAPKSPLQTYGRSKLAGEEVIMKYMNNYFIVRVSWVFGSYGNNFVKTIQRLSNYREIINVVNDQIGSPTYTADLVVLLCDIALSGKYGIYHATNEGCCSWAEFAQVIIDLNGSSCRINPVPSKQYPTKAVRPMNSRLSKTSLDESGFKRLPDWRDALMRFVKEQKNE